MEAERRRADLDDLKGILIFLVVFGHLIYANARRGEGLCYDVYFVIYCFHMPFFMFVSGLLTKRTTKEWVRKALVTYLAFNLLMYAVSFSDGLNSIFLEPTHNMWYLLLLVAFRVMATFFDRKTMWLVAIVSFVAFQAVPAPFPAIFVKFGAMLPFFVLGLTLRDSWNGIRNRLERTNPFVKEIAASASATCLLAFLWFAWRTPNAFALIHHSSPAGTTREFELMCVLALLAVAFILSVFIWFPNVPIPIVSKWDTLSIYLLHRPFALFVPTWTTDGIFVPICLAGAFVMCAVFGLKFFGKALRKFASLDLKVVVPGLCACMVAYVGIRTVVVRPAAYAKAATFPEIDGKKLDDCVKISYVGDMLLFENDERTIKDYDRLFERTKDSFGDLTLGVFEGVASEDGRSVGNYYDDGLLRIRFPREFVESMAKAVDFVALAQNHLYDGTDEDVERTLELFDELGIESSGLETQETKVVDVKGLKVSILSYADFMNFPRESRFPYARMDADEVLKDVRETRKNCDFLIVMLHTGEQFSHEPTERQKFFDELLSRNGADAVLTDHAHVVQPARFVGETFVCDCPGNYCSSLYGNDQNLGEIVNMYVNPETKKVEAASVVPIQSIVDPDDGLYVTTCREIENLNGTNLVLEPSIGAKVGNLEDEYFFDENGRLYLWTEDEERIPCFGNESVCFVGDSVSAGMTTNGHGWYERLERGETTRVAFSNATTTSLLGNEIPDADVYVVAIGCNDVRRDGKPAERFAEDLKALADEIPKGRRVIIVSPWYTTESDATSAPTYEERNALVDEYERATRKWRDENGYEYVDMYSRLREFFERSDVDEDDYLVDGIHPNANGIRLYGELFAEELGKSVERKGSSEDESDMPKERESGILQEKANAETERVEKKEKT